MPRAGFNWRPDPGLTVTERMPAIVASMLLNSASLKDSYADYEAERSKL